MKLFLAGVCCFLLFVTCGRAADDKALHFGISAVCGAGAETVLHYNSEMGPVSRVLMATAIGSLPGLAKELKDRGEPGNEFGVGDMTADVLGSFTGALTSCFINDAIQVRFKAGKKGGSVALMWEF